MISVELNPVEQKIARYIAKCRGEFARGAGIRDARMGPQRSEDIDLIGFGAEMAFAKLFNVYPDFNPGVIRESDCSRFGEAIDVKSSTYPAARLLAVPNKHVLAVDVYALVIVDWLYREDDAVARFRFVGFARAEELIAPERLTNLGHGPGYALEQDQLHEQQFIGRTRT